MGDFAETLRNARFHEIALEIARTIRTPTHFDDWATIAELYGRPYMIRRRPIGARGLYQALRIINRNISQVEYGIGENSTGVVTVHFRAPMPTHRRYEASQNKRRRCKQPLRMTPQLQRGEID